MEFRLPSSFVEGDARNIREDGTHKRERRMASLRDIRRHIGSVKNIKQITYAMKMVAAARIKRAQKSILNSRPFAGKMEETIRSLFAEIGEDDFKSVRESQLFEKSEKSGRAGLVVVTADKGLCGSFNVNVLKTAVKWMKENRDKKIEALVVGRKGKDFLRRLKGLDLEVAYEMIGIFPNVSYVHAGILCDEMFKLYFGGVDEVTLVYTEFKNMMSQKTRVKRVLPLKSMDFAGEEPKMEDFDFEPGKAEILANLLPRYLKAEFYRVLLESQAAELAARMNAMENASNNASDLIESLTLKLNKTRQAMITTELTEIVGGAEALGG